VARVRALTRRHGEQSVLSYADLMLDVGARRVTRAGRAIELTGRESDLLELLMREAGRTVTRERAIAEIWNDGAERGVVDRYVTRLRRKLGSPPLIRTLRGAGFALRV
jgi:two-component system, OmpR family, response regulator MprA